MSTTLTHSWFMTTRHLRNLARQPWWIAITLVQPIIWLLLFGAVFKATADIPGFAADSYVDFLTPGIVVMTAAFAGGWAGMGVIEDLNRGVIDRFLVSPVEWTVQAGREALTASPDWGLVLSRAGLLAALCVACTWLATRAFRSYQQSI